MPMPPIQFFVTMFRDERDQARSQYVLLWLMEALCRVNQSLIRSAEKDAKAGKGEKIPLLYRAGVHYEREPPGQEHWPDMVTLLSLFDGPGQYPGPWGDCEDLACWRVAELREAESHKDETGKRVGGGVKARPFAKWRRGSEGQFNYHALVLRPDGKIEDPSLTLGMRKEAEFAAEDTANKLKAGLVQPIIQFAEPPDVMVVDPDSPTGFGNRTDAKGLIGKPAPVPPIEGPNPSDDNYSETNRFDPSAAFAPAAPLMGLEEAQAKVREGTIKTYGMMDLSDFLGGQ